MKIIKNIFSIILIFSIIQVMGIVLINNKVYAETEPKKESFFEKIFSTGKKWDEMGKKDSDNLIQNASGIFEATNDIYNGIRVVGIIMFLADIALVAISISMKHEGKDIAGVKLTIGLTVLLAILFIFAGNIMEFLLGVFESFEAL